MGGALTNVVLMILNVLTILVFLRVIFQASSAWIDSYNPVVKLTFQATHMIDSFKSILPDRMDGRLNVAGVVLIIILRLVSLALSGYPIDGYLDGVYLVIISLVGDLLTFCKYIIWASIILSWVVNFSNFRSPIIDVIFQLCEPLLAPIRRIMPDTGPIDLSAMVALFGIYIATFLLGSVSVALLGYVV